ncbi:iron complex transport system ATP-binding protein [Roseovarius pacificus]|uniref:Iron complex transport system ATP-binding protein n=1 Tax=Roseovarius pacificus TaxID=337701 RepID=A0A1M6Y8Z3_9RHOB|nr:ABC transporter ATP-binding protein [Roseovarius pacificus]GGO51183.1 ABC transporter ATP-binding protein [Roseovarius pacificus]SHL14648.1 iron complex transport system ATP-binding protein [Roseovarius pacificus]
MIEVSNLSYSAGQAQILRDISLTIPQGGITAIIGPNGAGKSSLLHCIAGLLTPSGGQVRIDGLDPFDAPHRDRARAVALLQQTPRIATRLRVRELVAFGRWPHHGGRPGPEDARLTEEALATFDLTPLADRSLETLSGGQRQRALVAMTWAQSAPWLLLDEPLNALDPKYARDLMERLHDLTRPAPEQRSVVVVIHDINAAAGWADRVIALKDGEIGASGPCNDIMTPATLHAVFGMAFDVIDHKQRPVVIAR